MRIADPTDMDSDRVGGYRLCSLSYIDRTRASSSLDGSRNVFPFVEEMAKE